MLLQRQVLRLQILLELRHGEIHVLPARGLTRALQIGQHQLAVDDLRKARLSTPPPAARP